MRAEQSILRAQRRRSSQRARHSRLQASHHRPQLLLGRQQRSASLRQERSRLRISGSPGSAGTQARPQVVRPATPSSSLQTRRRATGAASRTPAAARIPAQKYSTNKANTTATLNVIAGGSAPLNYQWYTGSSGATTQPAPGATSTTLSVAPQVATTYWVAVQNTCGTSNSRTATVSVTLS